MFVLRQSIENRSNEPKLAGLIAIDGDKVKSLDSQIYMNDELEKLRLDFPRC